jgi:hypothetical protein
MRRKTSRDIYHEIKYHAIELSALVVFLSWLVREVLRQLRF